MLDPWGLMCGVSAYSRPAQTPRPGFCSPPLFVTLPSPPPSRAIPQGSGAKHAEQGAAFFSRSGGGEARVANSEG